MSKNDKIDSDVIEDVKSCEHQYAFVPRRILGLARFMVIGVCKKCGDNIEMTYSEYEKYSAEFKKKNKGSK